MENCLNLQKLRWDHNKDPVLVLRQQEEEASVLLASRRGPVDASNLFVMLVSTPYVAGFTHHSRHVTKNEQLLNLTFSTVSEPSPPFRLPAATSDCACADLSSLRVEKIHLSGSVREGTHVRVWSEIGSDVDAMLQLAPVRVLGVTTPNTGLRSRGVSAGVELRAETTANPGFVVLNHARREGCRHADKRAFSADRTIFLLDVFRARLDADKMPRREGPALSTHVADFQQHWKNTDLVPCVTADGCWPWRQFASRVRLAGQPSVRLARKLSELQVFLVPVGFPGSPTERDEWRVSFSRQEYVLLRDMSEEQRMCLTLLKTCKAILDLHQLKSYHLKTALLWLCEMQPRGQWTREGTRESLLSIISYLEEAVRRRRLECYFWPEMNIFATRHATQLSELSSDLRRLRDHLLSCSLALVSHWLSDTVPNIARRLLFSVTPVPRIDCLPVTMLTDTFLENLKRGQANGWGFLRGLSTCAVSPGALPMPFGTCFSLTFRSASMAFQKLLTSPDGGHELLGILLALLKTYQSGPDSPDADGEDSWAVGF